MDKEIRDVEEVCGNAHSGGTGAVAGVGFEGQIGGSKAESRESFVAGGQGRGAEHTDEEVVKALGLGVRTVERVRQRFVEEGFEASLNPKPQPRRARKLEGQVEGDLIALAKSDPPKGRKRWTLRLLADQMV